MTMLVVAAATLLSQPSEASAIVAPVTNVGAAKGDPTSARDEAAALPAAWKSSDDRLWTLRGDASGLRLYSATASSGYSWTTVAELAEPGSETDNWVGNGCITETGKYAAVVYAPRSYTNDASLTLRGARTAVIDLDSGKVTKLPITGAISYYNPGCGTGDSVVFTQLRYQEESGEDSATRLFRVDAATATTEATIELAGEYSSSVPVANGIVATHGADVVRIVSKSNVSKLANMAGPAGHLTVDASGGIVLLTGTEKSNQVVRLETRKGKQKPQVIAAQSGSWLGLQRGTGGRAFVLTASGEGKDLGHGVQRLTANSRSEVSTAGEAWIKPRPWTEKSTPSAVATTATRSPKPVELDVTMKDTGKSVAFTLPTVVRPSNEFDTGAAALPGHSALLNETEPTCGVRRNHPGAMALQPSPRGVEWAVDQAVMGNLTVARPENWNQSGLPSWSPQGMFPLPALVGGGHIPPQVLLGIVAQESNMWQTSHALTGEFGNTLIGDYYGRRWVEENNGATWGINYDHADCGYGIGQITDGMRVGQMTSNQQKAIAVDYATNIARAAQMLTQKWNELHAAGVIHSNGATSPIENWFFTVWSYNSGFYAQGESTGDRADPSHWGVGWLNNPANPIYRLDRGLFHKYEIDAKTPGDWSYPERIMGWAAYPIAKPEGAGYRQAWWTTEANRDNAQPMMGTFCDQRNHCDPSVDPGVGKTIGCPNVDSSCWWHWPATFNDCRTDVCGHEILRFNETYRDKEPKEGDANEPVYRYLPTCSTSGLPSNARIVDDVPASYVSPRPCAGSWSNDGIFTIEHPNPEAEIDLHQIGGGFGGHFWFAHDRDSDHYGGTNGQMTLTGSWKLRSPLDEDQAMVYVHIPDHGAHTVEAIYEVVTPTRTFREKLDQSQHESNEWVRLGAYWFGDSVPEIRLSNSNSSGTADDDVAWDAVAFVPGDFDTLPDVRVPDPDPDAPEPNHNLQTPRTRETNGITTSSSADKSADETRTCKVVSQQKICTSVSTPTSAELANLSVDPAGQILGWCTPPVPTSIKSDRVEGCISKRVEYEWCQAAVVCSSASFIAVQEYRLNIDSADILEAVTLYPDQIDANLGVVTISNVFANCSPDCSGDAARWSGEPSWVAGTADPATLLRQYRWTNSAAGAMQKLELSETFHMEASAAPDHSHKPFNVELNDEIRCDSKQTSTNSGCVFYKYAPTMRMNFRKYPIVAAYYWTISQMMTGHPGRYPDSPLHKETDPDVGEINREVVCARGDASTRISPDNYHPGATADVGGRNCDEYPFAMTKESGGQIYNQAPDYGSRCATFYGADTGSYWRLFVDDRFKVPAWNERCARASIAAKQNQAAGSTFASFATRMRLNYDDAFYVSVPELDGCDLTVTCTVP